MFIIFIKLENVFKYIMWIISCYIDVIISSGL